MASGKTSGFPSGWKSVLFFRAAELKETTAKLQLQVGRGGLNSMRKSWQVFCQLWLLPAGSKGRWSASNFNLKAKVFNFKSCLLPFSSGSFHFFPFCPHFVPISRNRHGNWKCQGLGDAGVESHYPRGFQGDFKPRGMDADKDCVAL